MSDPPHQWPTGPDPDPGGLLLVVVGAHLRAEAHDRPVADRIVRRMNEWLEGASDGDDRSTPRALACTDLWYLNDDRLRPRPAVSVGAPEVNALTAYLAGRLPSAFVVDDVLSVQLDVELTEPIACVWGVDRASTDAAADAFIERYFDAFMRAAVGAGSA